jgi:Protein of unknown function (DUF2927)
MFFRRRNGSVAGILIATAMALAVVGDRSAHAEDQNISNRRASERTEFTNDEIKNGFFKIAFHAELQFDARAERLRKFDQPVRIFVINKGLPDRAAEIAAIAADIQAHVNHLDLAVTNDRAAANFIVRLVARRDFAQTIRTLYGSSRATQIQKSLSPQCLSGIGKDSLYRIHRAEVILPVDAGDFAFYDCAYEEMLQALGAINDDRSVPWTMFNDDVQMGFFDVYDQYLLNILYDPHLRPGMTEADVNRVLPAIFPAARAWVASVNARRAEQRDEQGRAEAAATPSQSVTALVRSTEVNPSHPGKAGQD